MLDDFIIIVTRLKQHRKIEDWEHTSEALFSCYVMDAFRTPDGCSYVSNNRQLINLTKIQRLLYRYENMIQLILLPFNLTVVYSTAKY